MGHEDKLASLGWDLGAPPAPAGSYVPARLAGGLLFVSGQIPVRDGKLRYSGSVSDENVDDARASARLCALNVLAHARAALGTLDDVEGVARVTGYVSSAPGFAAHADIINAASDVFAEVFGEAGRHARAAVGVASLPLGAMTEVDAIMHVRHQGGR